MGDVIADLRKAMAEFDGCTPAERGFRVRSALRVLSLVRELLAEVDGEMTEDVWVAPPGTPIIAVGARDDDYSAEAMDRASFGAEPLGGVIPGVAGSHLPD